MISFALYRRSSNGKTGSNSTTGSNIDSSNDSAYYSAMTSNSGTPSNGLSRKSSGKNNDSGSARIKNPRYYCYTSCRKVYLMNLQTHIINLQL